MEPDNDKIDQATLALLWLNSFQDGDVRRAWKGFDWDALDRLHEKGYLNDPRSKAKSVVLTVLPGCWSQGATEQEALANIKNAIEEYLEVLDDQLMNADVREVEVSV